MKHRMSSQEYSLFESAVQITEERDKKSLEHALIEALSEYIDFDAILLLRLPCRKYLEVAESMPKSAFKDKLNLIRCEHGDQRVEPDNSINLCIENREIITVGNNSAQRKLFPISVNNAVKGVLDIYGHRSANDTEKLIQGFIHIYSNFLSIMYDNEHDTLTGLLNRKTFDRQIVGALSSTEPANNSVPITEEKRRKARKNTSHWIGILDIDHFKNINDNFGHIYGDEVLLLFANIMEKTFRNSDLLFRYGGEEFVVLLRPTTESDAFLVFERFRKNLETYDFPQIGRITVSIGMVEISSQEGITTVLEHADQALYYAKEHGRNQICNYHELINSGLLEIRQIGNHVELF